MQTFGKKKKKKPTNNKGGSQGHITVKERQTIFLEVGLQYLKVINNPMQVGKKTTWRIVKISTWLNARQTEGQDGR